MAWLRALLGCGVTAEMSCDAMTKRVADQAHKDLVDLRLCEKQLQVNKEALELMREEVIDLKQRLHRACDRITEHRNNTAEQLIKVRQLTGEVRRCRRRFEDQGKSLDSVRQGADEAMTFLYRNSSEGSEAFEIACMLADKLNS